MSEISVTRALSEVNTLKKRISKLIKNTTFLSTKVSGQAWRDHIHETKSNWQAINDLLMRYEKVKFAIIDSNARTEVKIGERTYTVAQAITMKEVLQRKQELLDQLRHSRQSTQQTVDLYTQTVQRKLDNLLETNFKKDCKNDESDIKTISEAYLKKNTIEVIDPININRQINSLDEELDNFLKEVDFALSESNARTMVVL